MGVNSTPVQMQLPAVSGTHARAYIVQGTVLLAHNSVLGVCTACSFRQLCNQTGVHDLTSASPPDTPSWACSAESRGPQTHGSAVWLLQ